MKKPLLFLGALILGAWAIARWAGSGKTADGSDPSLVVNRLWVDRLPVKPKDTANIFATITRQKLGVFQSVSQYKGSYELFTFTAVGGELRVVYPQTDQQETVQARAWKCKEEDMDFCLELTGASRGVKRYHSLDGWEIRDASTPEQLLERATSVVRASN
jgi:hypothetical protein